VANFLQILPSLLVYMQASGSTSFSNAFTEGFEQMPVSRPSIDCADLIHITRNIFLALTDGEDTASSANSRAVHRIVRFPQIQNFMFIAVMLDVNVQVLESMSSWFLYTHAKRIDVAMRTGRSLVALFGETVIHRMLRDDDAGAASYYNPARGTVLRAGCVEPPREAAAPIFRASRGAPAPTLLPGRGSPPPYSCIDPGELLGLAATISLRADDGDDDDDEFSGGMREADNSSR
jgi:hypothetical protein